MLANGQRAASRPGQFALLRACPLLLACLVIGQALLLPSAEDEARSARRQALAERTVMREGAWRPTASEPPRLRVPSPVDYATVVVPSSSADLLQVFDSLSYRLGAVRTGLLPVPRLYVTGLPGDLAQIPESDSRKRTFIRAILPLVLLANEEIAARRSRLLALERAAQAGRQLSPGDLSWRRALALHYQVAPEDTAELLRRVDEVPVSLALAQAILESGWGRSRFARTGNALFGQRASQAAHAGIAAAAAPRVRVRAFPDLMASVRSYMHNLNVNRSYRSFRAARAAARAEGRRPGGTELAERLGSYAEIEDYAARLRAMIRHNGLADFDEARLGGSVVALRFGRPEVGG